MNNRREELFVKELQKMNANLDRIDSILEEFSMVKTHIADLIKELEKHKSDIRLIFLTSLK